ncbi:hypothetical protein D3C84_195600 [compost metagenome]
MKAPAAASISRLTCSPLWISTARYAARPLSAPAISAVRRCRMAWSGTTASTIRAMRVFSRRAGVSTSCSPTRGPGRCPMPGSTPTKRGASRRRGRLRRGARSRSRHRSRAPSRSRRCRPCYAVVPRATAAAWWCLPPAWARPGWPPSMPSSSGRGGCCSSPIARRSSIRRRKPSCAFGRPRGLVFIGASSAIARWMCCALRCRPWDASPISNASRRSTSITW